MFRSQNLNKKLQKRGATTDDLDLDICYQSHNPEQFPTSFNRRSLFVKKLLTKKV